MYLIFSIVTFLLSSPGKPLYRLKVLFAATICARKKTKALLLIIPGSKAIVHPRGKKTCTSPEVCKNPYQGIVDECNDRRPDGRCDKCCN